MQEFQLDVVAAGGGHAVLQVGGEVDLYTAPQLRERAIGLVAKGTVHILVDMTSVVFLDSSGLEVLVDCFKRLGSCGGSLLLVVSAERVLRIFRITGLTAVFALHPSIPEAIEANSRWRQALESEAGKVEEWCRREGLL